MKSGEWAEKGADKGGDDRLQIAFGKVGPLHLMLQQTDFERMIAVNRNHQTIAMPSLGKDMMTAVDRGQLPAMPLQKTDKVFS